MVGFALARALCVTPFRVGTGAVSQAVAFAGDLDQFGMVQEAVEDRRGGRDRSLHEVGWSNRRIARELGIHRTTVAGYLEGRDDSKPTKVPTGSEGKSDEANERSRSLCEPYRETILQKLGQGLSAQRIFQDLGEVSPGTSKLTTYGHFKTDSRVNVQCDVTFFASNGKSCGRFSA